MLSLPLLLPSVVNAYVALSPMSDISLVRSKRDSSYPFQGRMGLNGVNNSSPLINKSLASGVNVSGYYQEESSRPNKNSSYSFKNKLHLGTNSSSSSKSKAQVSAGSSPPNRPVSFPLGVCPLAGSKTPDKTISSKLKAPLNSTKGKSGSQRPPSLHRKRSLNLFRDFLTTRYNSRLVYRMENTGGSNPNPDGWTTADVGRWPGTNALPVPPPGHNQAWNAAWIRGKAAWNALPFAQRSLEDNDLVDMTDWYFDCMDSQYRPERCDDNEILATINNVANPGIAGMLCSNTYNYWKTMYKHDRFHYDTALSTPAGSIINEFWWGGSQYDLQKPYEWAPVSWADAIIRLWSDQSRKYGVLPAVLEFITFTEIGQAEAHNVIDDIVEKNPSLADTEEGGASEWVETYTPDDDNFFALLGTKECIGAIELLYNYPYTFSWKDNDGTRLVKSIKSVKFSRNPLPDENFMWGLAKPEFPTYTVVFQIEDIYPPG